tara:strand:- start:595 stop:825 length:231 start_codon:yes stop_codon:yes gene_type:complete
MTDTQIVITESDLQTIITQKVNQCVNLEVQVAALSRVLQEKSDRIVELEGKLVSLNGKEADNAKSREKEVSLYPKG